MSGLTTKALRSYVPLMEDEVQKLIDSDPQFRGASGTANIAATTSRITLYTSSRTLQGKEFRGQLDDNFMSLYHALDEGLKPINFIIPWLPLPHKRKRDAANRKMTQLYIDIIQARRARTNSRGESQVSEDLIWSLMESTYKDGTPIPDHEIAHMMIALLMAGQESSSVTSCWTMLHLAANPSLIEELYEEQLRFIGPPSTPLTYENVHKLPLLTATIRETLRLHSPIHSIMRKVKTPLPIADTPFEIPPSHILLATPATIMKSNTYYTNPEEWAPHRWDRMADPREQEREKMDYGYGVVATGADSHFLPFGAGRHRCIGEQFALVQLTVVVSVLVRNLRFRNPEGQSGVVESDYAVSLLLYYHHAQQGHVRADLLWSDCFRRQRDPQPYSGSGARQICSMSLDELADFSVLPHAHLYIILDLLVPADRFR